MCDKKEYSNKKINIDGEKILCYNEIINEHLLKNGGKL